MPSFYDCREMYGIESPGDEHKRESATTMDETWWEDPQSQTAFVYDYYHDDHRNQMVDLDPLHDPKKTPLDIKYIVNSSQTYAKDLITYHIQLRPFQKCNVGYYDEFFKNRYGANFPNGLYIDIKDAKGKYNRWLVVSGANFYDPQFPTFEILPCTYVFQWVYGGKKYQTPGVLRSQSSYNSGVWSADKITTTEDQQKLILPLNRDTEHIYYNLRAIIDAPVLTEPRAWEVTKVNRIQASGLLNLTFAQDKFDQFRDYIELDDNGNVIGMWADYYSSTAEPEPVEEIKPKNLSITFSGVSAELKVGGGYKKFTVSSDAEVDYSLGTWKFSIDGKDASDLVTTSTEKLESNQIKVKFNGDEDYLGKVMTISYVLDDENSADLNVSIVSL